jgi:AraC family transcriptional regulator
MLAPCHAPRQTQIEQRLLHDGALLQMGYIAVRPASSLPGALETAQRHVLALPLAGVFAKHDGPRQTMLATPGHALLITAGRPYRLSFPACLGDRCLALRLTSEGLAQAMPEAQRGEGFDLATFAPHVPLPGALMLARSRLFARLRRGDMDGLDAEEQGLSLLRATLVAARRQPLHASSDTARRVRHVRRTQELVWTQPERPWTLTELAAQACVSASHLAHAFRAETGSSLYGYVLRARLTRALDAVLDSDAALTTVALDAGFSSHSHFTARFRAYFGDTPSALRMAATGTIARELRRNVTASLPHAA